MTPTASIVVVVVVVVTIIAGRFGLDSSPPATENDRSAINIWSSHGHHVSILK